MLLGAGSPAATRFALGRLAEEQVERQRGGGPGEAGGVGAPRKEVAAAHGGLWGRGHLALLRFGTGPFELIQDGCNCPPACSPDR